MNAQNFLNQFKGKEIKEFIEQDNGGEDSLVIKFTDNTQLIIDSGSCSGFGGLGYRISNYRLNEFNPGHWHILDRNNLPIYDKESRGEDKPIVFTNYDIAIECLNKLNSEISEYPPVT